MLLTVEVWICYITVPPQCGMYACTVVKFYSDHDLGILSQRYVSVWCSVTVHCIVFFNGCFIVEKKLVQS